MLTQGLASHWDLVRMHFMEWRPRARAAARSRWYAAVAAAVAGSAAEAAQQAAAQPVELPSAAAPRQEAAVKTAAADAAVQPATATQPLVQHDVPDAAMPSSDAAARDAKPVAQGQGRLVSLVARATGSWRGPRPSLLIPPLTGSPDSSTAPTALPHQLELQRSASSPLSSQLRARFEGLAAVVAPGTGPDGETAARRRALGGFSRRRLQAAKHSGMPRGVAVH